MLQVSAIMTELLMEHGIRPIIVGGLSVNRTEHEVLA
jgi:hypothetical protein